MRHVLTHAIAVCVGIALAVGSAAFAGSNHATDATHNQIMRRLGNSYVYTPSGTLAAQVGDVRREIQSVSSQLRRLCQTHGTTC
jgi:hypothetical protein